MHGDDIETDGEVKLDDVEVDDHAWDEGAYEGDVRVRAQVPAPEAWNDCGADETKDAVQVSGPNNDADVKKDSYYDHVNAAVAVAAVVVLTQGANE